MTEEKGYKKLEPSAQKCMRVNAIIASVIGLAIGVAALYFLLFRRFQLVFWIAASAYVVLLIVMEIIITPKFRYERYRYGIGEDAIRVREGFIWIKETIVPIERLHKIEMSQGPIDRIFKLSSVVITTAGGDCKINFLDTEEAEVIAEKLKDKINQIAIEERKKING